MGADPLERRRLPDRGPGRAIVRQDRRQPFRHPRPAAAPAPRLFARTRVGRVMTVPYAEVIGDPIAHSKSPLIHKFWLEKLGIDADYRRTRVTADELASFIAMRRSDPDWRGCSVTMPLKQAVLAHSDEVDGRTAAVGAVNALHPVNGRLIGANTDVPGILDVLPIEYFCSDALPEVCIIGAGGAARAMLAACRERLVSLVFFNVRDPDKAWPLLEEWRFGGTVGGLDNDHNLTTP